MNIYSCFFDKDSNLYKIELAGANSLDDYWEQANKDRSKSRALSSSFDDEEHYLFCRDPGNRNGECEIVLEGPDLVETALEAEVIYARDFT